jgi:GNAT superfamily N-acetyltransferase
MTEVRVATINDVPQLVNLLTILFTQEADFIPDGEKQTEGLNQIIENSSIGDILVLSEQDRIVGMVCLLYTISTALGGKVAILEDMILEPASRGKGQGTLLLKEAIHFAQKNDCRRITLLTDLFNTEAIRFYQNQGFVKSAMTPLRLLF